MDYRTKPTSRVFLRLLAPWLRSLFGVYDMAQPFPVLQALEMLPDVFDETTVEIVEDDEMPYCEKANCVVEDEGFTIKIKQSVYDSAYKDGNGAALGFICHEICHVFLYKVGFQPIMSCSFANNAIPAYCSVEWQTKALCGEVMMPYEATKNLSEEQIVQQFKVSKAFAKKRKTY